MSPLLEKLRATYGTNGTLPKAPTPVQVERAIKNGGDFEKIPSPPQLKKRKKTK